jgi:hypothetical protein
MSVQIFQNTNLDTRRLLNLSSGAEYISCQDDKLLQKDPIACFALRQLRSLVGSADRREVDKDLKDVVYTVAKDHDRPPAKFTQHTGEITYATEYWEFGRVMDKPELLETLAINFAERIDFFTARIPSWRGRPIVFVAHSEMMCVLCLHVAKRLLRAKNETDWLSGHEVATVLLQERGAIPATPAMLFAENIYSPDASLNWVTLSESPTKSPTKFETQFENVIGVVYDELETRILKNSSPVFIIATDLRRDGKSHEGMEAALLSKIAKLSPPSLEVLEIMDASILELVVSSSNQTEGSHQNASSTKNLVSIFREQAKAHLKSVDEQTAKQARCYSPVKGMVVEAEKNEVIDRALEKAGDAKKNRRYIASTAISLHEIASSVTLYHRYHASKWASTDRSWREMVPRRFARTHGITVGYVDALHFLRSTKDSVIRIRAKQKMDSWLKGKISEIAWQSESSLKTDSLASEKAISRRLFLLHTDEERSKDCAAIVADDLEGMEDISSQFYSIDSLLVDNQGSYLSTLAQANERDVYLIVTPAIRSGGFVSTMKRKVYNAFKDRFKPTVLVLAVTGIDKHYNSERTLVIVPNSLMSGKCGVSGIGNVQYSRKKVASEKFFRFAMKKHTAIHEFLKNSGPHGISFVDVMDVELRRVKDTPTANDRSVRDRSLISLRKLCVMIGFAKDLAVQRSARNDLLGLLCAVGVRKCTLIDGLLTLMMMVNVDESVLLGGIPFPEDLKIIETRRFYRNILRVLSDSSQRSFAKILFSVSLMGPECVEVFVTNLMRMACDPRCKALHDDLGSEVQLDLEFRDLEQTLVAELRRQIEFYRKTYGSVRKIRGFSRLLAIAEWKRNKGSIKRMDPCTKPRMDEPRLDLRDVSVSVD